MGTHTLGAPIAELQPDRPVRSGSITVGVVDGCEGVWTVQLVAFPLVLAAGCARRWCDGVLPVAQPRTESAAVRRRDGALRPIAFIKRPFALRHHLRVVPLCDVAGDVAKEAVWHPGDAATGRNRSAHYLAEFQIDAGFEEVSVAPALAILTGPSAHFSKRWRRKRGLPHVRRNRP